jgi:predicted PurR-regulated permease PerM
MSTQSKEDLGKDPPPLRAALLPDLTSLVRFAVVSAAVMVILWLIGQFVMLVFAGILVAVALRGTADYVVSRTGMPGSLALTLVMVFILLAFGGGGAWLAVDITHQMRQIWEQVNDVAKRLGDAAWLQDAIEQVADAQVIATTVGRFALGFLGALGTLGGVLVVGAFMAATWTVYRDGFLRMFPVVRRGRVAFILSSTAHALRWWFLGQLVSMLSLGIMTGVGLWALGIPLWPALALLTAVLTFIPYFGPIIAGAPILMISFTQGIQDGVYATVLYLIVQTLESNVIMPLVQQRVVSLPPAVTLSAQVVFGILFGVLGFILATPLAAGALVLVRMAYVEDLLGDDLEKPALRPASSQTS